MSDRGQTLTKHCPDFWVLGVESAGVSSILPLDVGQSGADMMIDPAWQLSSLGFFPGHVYSYLGCKEQEHRNPVG